MIALLSLIAAAIKLLNKNHCAIQFNDYFLFVIGVIVCIMHTIVRGNELQ